MVKYENRSLLGEAIVFWDQFENEFRSLASEGAHANFAPRNKDEIELLHYLLNQFTPVSYNRLLSKAGLKNIYDFVKNKYGEKSATLEADVIIETALANLTNKDDLCVQTLDLFVSIYGAEAGNLALKCTALGGIYVGGSIAPKIIDKLHDGTFMQAFKDREDKETIVNVLASIPVKVVKNPDVGFFGAAKRAFDREMIGFSAYSECRKQQAS